MSSQFNLYFISKQTSISISARHRISMSNHQHECYRLHESLKNVNRMWILMVKRSFRFTKEHKAMLAGVVFFPLICLLDSFILSLFVPYVSITFRSKAKGNYRVRVFPLNVIRSCFGPLPTTQRWGHHASRLPETAFYYSNSCVFFLSGAFAPCSIWKAADIKPRPWFNWIRCVNSHDEFLSTASQQVFNIAELEEEVGRKTEWYQRHLWEMKIFDEVRAFLYWELKLAFPVHIKA